jgi:hypothetical protein
MVRRIEVQTDDVAHLLDEEGVIGEFEVALAMRLHAEQIEPALHRTLRDTGAIFHRAHAPLRGIGRRTLQGGVDHFGNLFVGEGAGSAGA